MSESKVTIDKTLVEPDLKISLDSPNDDCVSVVRKLQEDVIEEEYTQLIKDDDVNYSQVLN
ncbi:hypothetical protein CHBEV_064 [Choristoneura biennis entomopoxvirus]|uniref:Uncharacterized protein n=1 Tax=Choristoneura biennis entomopoxvirus TaxID=10288 RepID=A0A916NXL5_CBEPV|nr:hypothetical protein CHBEV_064 [Choristoneura biennis entomopoxvirus]CCU55632.1 hypothetical protein CHBEV_064 [Choristoneura biennis entomopoxvirus]